LVRTEAGTIPIEVKSRSCGARGPYAGEVAQVAAYCLLVEDSMGVAVPYGLLQLADREIRVPFTPERRAKVLALLAKMVAAGQCEDIPRQRGKQGNDAGRAERSRLVVVTESAPREGVGKLIRNRAEENMMSEGLNDAEKIVFTLCKRSFLRLWSYANPQGKNSSKELCDVLVVCPPDVIIFSVKEIGLKESDRPDVEMTRWLKRAVEESANQIYGAERHVRSSANVVCADGTPGMELPKPPDLRVHRVAIAAGSRGKVPLPLGDFGKGFVHVFDEMSTLILLSELNSVTDFVEYLTAKEAFCSSMKYLSQVREEDLLTIYLHGGRKFPDDPPDVLSIGDELWDGFIARPEVKAKKEADQISYVWDRLIDQITSDVLNDNMEPGSSPSNTERALRVMAREDRFSRRVLGEAFKEFIDESVQHPLARMLCSPSGVVYVFLAHPRDARRDIRQMELQNRCFVARGLHPQATTVVGIATEQYSKEGHSLDLALHHQPEWREEHQEMVKKMQESLGYFVNSRQTKQSVDEYPNTEGVPASE